MHLGALGPAALRQLGDPLVLLLGGVAVPLRARFVGGHVLDVREEVGVGGRDVPGALLAADREEEDLPAGLFDIGRGREDGTRGHGGEEGQEAGTLAVRRAHDGVESADHLGFVDLVGAHRQELGARVVGERGAAAPAVAEVHAVVGEREHHGRVVEEVLQGLVLGVPVAVLQPADEVAEDLALAVVGDVSVLEGAGDRVEDAVGAGPSHGVCLSSWG
ncbi:hypothetical protein STTU_4926 [Streptomyces sp. Tu6071]|nr:hypothetical protein STTU_4926 [Streptomyces sp. Tu6071]